MYVSRSKAHKIWACSSVCVLVFFALMLLVSFDRSYFHRIINLLLYKYFFQVWWFSIHSIRYTSMKCTDFFINILYFPSISRSKCVCNTRRLSHVHAIHFNSNKWTHRKWEGVRVYVIHNVFNWIESNRIGKIFNDGVQYSISPYFIVPCNIWHKLCLFLLEAKNVTNLCSVFSSAAFLMV